MISFFVPGDPRAQGRPRTRVLRLGSRSVAQIYNPHNADDWKARVQIIARPFVPKSPMLGPIRLRAVFLLPRPKTHYRKAGLREEAPDWHINKPDADNFIKAVKDALTAIRLWGDDSLVCDEHTLKIYNETPGCFITIEPITTPPEIPELCLNSEAPKTSPEAISPKSSRSISTFRAR